MHDVVHACCQRQEMVQHFCHHGDTIGHPNPSYVTTKLYGTSTCGCNNNTIFQKELLSSIYLVLHAKLATVNTVEFVINAKYYYYVVKWCSGVACNMVCIAEHWLDFIIK